jgi:hypothetical protein
MRRTGMEQNRAAEFGIRRAERFQGAGERQDSYPGAAGHGMPGSLEAAGGAEGLGPMMEVGVTSSPRASIVSVR